MASLSQINVAFRVDLKGLSTQMQNASRQIAKAGENMKTLGRSFGLAFTMPLLAAGVAGIKFSADLEDAIGATDQIFKNATGSVKAWADSLPSYYGIAKKEALEYSNMMGSMLVNIGKLTNEQASEQSAKLIELAGDLTAMYGGTTADAVRALTGALKGNNTMLDNYGMAVNDTLIKARALEMGLMKQGGQMSLSAKQAATLSLIYEQTAAAQGQAAREADGASGATRGFSTAVSDLSTSLGSVLLPYFTKAALAVTGYVKRISEMNDSQKKLVVGFGLVAAAIGPVLYAFGSFMTALPGIIQGFKNIRNAVLAMNAAFLANPITAVVTALAALVTISVVANSRFGELTNAKKEFDEVTKKASSSVASEVVETKKLLDVAQDKKRSDDERNAALKRLISKSKEHFGQLTLETIGTAKAKKAVDDYTASLIRNARVKAAEEKLVEIQKRKLELSQGISDEDGPSVMQTIGGKLKSQFFPVPTLAEDRSRAVSRAKNAMIVTQELDKLEKAFENIVRTEGSVAVVSSDVDDEFKNLGDSAKNLKKEVEDLGVIGSVKWMQAQISEMEEARSKMDVTSDGFSRLTDQIAVYQKTLDSIENPAKVISEGSEEWYTSQIAQMQEQLRVLDMTSDAYVNLSAQIKVYEATLDLLKNKREEIDSSAVGSSAWYEKEISGVKELMSELEIGSDAYLKLANELSLLERTYKISLDVTNVVENVSVLKTVAENVRHSLEEAFSSMADGMVSSMGTAENGLERFAQSMYKTVVKVIAMALSSSIANAIQGGSQSGVATGPGAIVAIPAMIATLVGGIFTAFAAIPKFADGGIVYGPTVGLMGEYAGASSNPEVIAPLNKLKELIEPAYGGVSALDLSGEFVIKGSDLLLALDRTSVRNKRVY